MITLDTSGLLALVDSADPYHTACIAVLDTDPGPYLLPVPILSEIAWMLENRYPSRVEKSFLEDIRTGAYELNWDSKDTARIEVLVERYKDLPLGLADAAVIACTERNGGRTLSTDHRHFMAVAREGTITVLPA